MTTKNRNLEDSARHVAFSALLEPKTIFTALEKAGVKADVVSAATDSVTTALKDRILHLHLAVGEQAEVRDSREEEITVVNVALPSKRILRRVGLQVMGVKRYARDNQEAAIDRALQQRISRGGERLHYLVHAVEELLSSDDESDLEALEVFIGQYQETEELELVKKLRGISFLQDEPRIHRARLHAKFQKAIRDEFQFYNQTTLAEKIGGETPAALQRIRRWIDRGELFSVDDGKKLIPEFLIDWETKLPHALVAETMASFPESTSGWTLAYWMCQGHELLMGLRPVDIMNESPDDYQRALKSLNNDFDR